MTFEDFYPWIVSGIGGAIGAALLLPTRWGEALVKYRFETLIAKNKTDSDRDMASLRARLDHLGDRGKRSNELEFLAVQNVWEKTIELFLSAGSATYAIIEHPNLANFSDADLTAFLSTSSLTELQRSQVSQAQDRNATYVQIVTWRQIVAAAKGVYDCNLALRKNRIFMPDDLRARFQSAIDLCNRAVVEKKLSFQHPNIAPGQWGNGIIQFSEQSDAALNELAQTVNERLFRDEHI